MEAILNLHLCVSASKVVECAAELRRRLPPDQLLILRQLAAELVTAAESESAGCRVVLVPAAAEREALATLGLKAAGRER